MSKATDRKQKLVEGGKAMLRGEEVEIWILKGDSAIVTLPSGEQRLVSKSRLSPKPLNP